MIDPSSPFFLQGLELSGHDWLITYAIETGTGGTQEAEVKLSFLLGNITEDEHNDLYDSLQSFGLLAAFVDTDVNEDVLLEALTDSCTKDQLLQMQDLIDQIKEARTDEMQEVINEIGMQSARAFMRYASGLNIISLQLHGLLDQTAVQFTVAKRKGYVSYKVKLPSINLTSFESNRKSCACIAYLAARDWLAALEKMCARLVEQSVGRQSSQLKLFASGQYDSPFAEEANSEIEWNELSSF